MRQLEAEGQRMWIKRHGFAEPFDFDVLHDELRGLVEDPITASPEDTRDWQILAELRRLRRRYPRQPDGLESLTTSTSTDI